MRAGLWECPAGTSGRSCAEELAAGIAVEPVFPSGHLMNGFLLPPPNNKVF